jgi:hypothetical protein
MLSFSDVREVGARDERLSRCLFCGRAIVLLPDDRRNGACFDCLALSVPEAVPCPECGAGIPGESRALGCGTCGWFPLGH